MSLRLGLVLMLWLVTALAGLATLGWTASEAYRAAAFDTRTTFARAGEVLERNYHMAGAWANDRIFGERTSIALLGIMAPGTCIDFRQTGISARRLCAGWQVFGEIPPHWFRVLAGRAFDPPEPLERDGTGSQNATFSLRAQFDPVAASTLAWQRVRLALGQTLTMAGGVLLLGTLAILWRLGPVGRIVAALHRLAENDLSIRIAPEGAEEFRRIGNALNGLAIRLEESAARQRALTRKLLEVEDVERRQLARDLHDAFGQTLTATSALAASVALAAGPDRPEIARDARAIGDNTRAMMQTLRGAFARLRPPDLEEVGLVASLRAMLAGWEVQSCTTLHLAFDLDEARLPPSVALDLYRIVQECVTNAMRHGRPGTVRMALKDRPDGSLHLVVEDDGGGSLAEAAEGHGILGIRERVAAMGGMLEMETTPEGVRVAVTVPRNEKARAA